TRSRARSSPRRVCPPEPYPLASAAMSPRRRRLSHAAPLLALLAIVAVAAWLRFWALGFGLPHALARPDEKEILEPTLRFARGELNPQYHVYPGLYLYSVWLWGEAGLRVRGFFAPTPPYPTAVQKDIAGLPGGTGGDVLRIGRALSALAGTLTVLAVYLVARPRAGPSTGLVAAALLATCFLHVRDSHALKAEALLTLAMVPALAACARVAEQPTARRAASAGVWIGIATGMKQPGSLLLVPLYAAGVLGSRGSGWRRFFPAVVVLGALVAVAVFVATGPYLVLDWGFVWKQMGPSVGTVLAPEGGAAQPRAFPYHVTVSLRHGAGLAFALLVLPAVAYGFVGAEPLFFLGALFSLLWFFVIGVSPVHHVRYLTPILPVLCLLVARLLVRAARPLGRAAVPALAVATVAIAAEPFAASVAHDRILAETDTRVLAARWLADHARAGDEVAVLGTMTFWGTGYGVPVMPPGVRRRDLHGDDRDVGGARFVLTHEHQLPFSRVDPAAFE